MTAKEYLEKEKKCAEGLNFACWKYQLDGAIIELMEGYAVVKNNVDLADVRQQRELLIAFLKWRKGEQLTSETITEIDNYLADESNL